MGIGVHRAARVGAAAHGGQVLLSETARGLAADDLPVGVTLRDLVCHRLKDIDEPVRLYQVVATGWPGFRHCGHWRTVVVVVAGSVCWRRSWLSPAAPWRVYCS